MTQQLSFLNLSLKKVLDSEPDSFKKAKIKIAFIVQIFTLIKIAVIVPAAIQHTETMQLLRVLCFAVAYLFLIKLLLYRPATVLLTGHVVAISGLSVIFSSLFIYEQPLNIVTIQVIFMSVLVCFYLLDKTAAFIYTFLAIVPFVLFLLFHTGNKLNLGLVPQELESPVYEIIVILNFITFVLIHYLYYQSFYENLKEKEVLNHQLELNIDEAKALADSRSLFLSTMSHELRTPLNGVIGMANLLKDTALDEQKDNLDILEFSATNLLSVINDILDYNKSELDKIELESIPVNLPALLRKICSGLQMKAVEKALSWKLEIDERLKDLSVQTDPTRLTQIIYNLAGNAIKFTEDGLICVKAVVLDKHDEHISVRFSISDTGIGIPADRHDAIFDPFIQASTDTTRHYGGTGLGLAIVRRLVKLFDSTIHLESQLGKGSEFSFDINFTLCQSGINTATDFKPEKLHLKGLKLLIVEDNRINILLLQRLLLKWEAESVIAINGQDALNRLSNENFDAVLMDLHMPVMDGYAATMAIRSLNDPEKAKIPIIALTASVSHNVYAKIKEVGMQDYLPKPFQADQLYRKLQQIYTPPLELGEEPAFAG